MSDRIVSARGPVRRSFRRSPAPALLLAGGLLLLVLGACSSEDPNTVGEGLVEVELEAMLDTLDVDTVLQYRGIPVGEEDLPVRDHEALYLGEQEGTASSIVVQFDFDAVTDDSLTAETYSLENIASVNLRVLMMEAFVSPDSSQSDPLLIAPWSTYYQLYHLDAPIDTTAFPGPEPALGGLTNLNTEYELDISKRVNIEVRNSDLVEWMTAGGVHSFLIREGDGSGYGLVGYSSMDNVHGGSTLDETVDFDSLGPSFNVKLIDPDTTVTIAPIFDCSTFHEVEEAPQDLVDGFILRTSLRSYPALYFDFSSLPADAFINRAVLAVANDTTRAWGQLESIVVSEFPIERFGAEGDTLDLKEIEDAVYPVVGMTSLNPTYHRRMEFNITTAVQRIVNGAYEGERGFILTAGEDFLENYDTTTLDPDLYLNQFIFYGSNATDPILRPRLKITYSIAEQGGGL